MSEHYRSWEPVGKVKCSDVMPGCGDPTGRFAAFRRGASVLVMDTQPHEPVQVAQHRGCAHNYYLVAVHPDGQRLAVRDKVWGYLQVRTPEEILRRRKTPTALLSWDGDIIAPKAGMMPPRWGFADEFLGFSADGEHLMLATHQEDGQACVQLYRTEDLELVDSLTDWRAYSFYATWEAGAEPDQRRAYVPMTVWAEGGWVQDPLEPGLWLGIRNAGDSCLALTGVRAVGGKLEPVDHAALAKPIFETMGSYVMLGMCLLPQGGLLVIERDHHMARFPWPIHEGARPQAKAHLSDTLYNEDYELVLPWQSELEGGTRLEPSDTVSVTQEHLLVNINEADHWRTEALAALDPVTFQLLGLVRRPPSRIKFEELIHLGKDLFVGAGASTAQLWRLKA